MIFVDQKKAHNCQTQDNKFWPAVGRVDDAYGDRNLMCTCLPLESYKE